MAVCQPAGRDDVWICGRRVAGGFARSGRSTFIRKIKRLWKIAEEASKRGERFQAEYRIVRKDGRVIWVSDTAAVVPGSDAHPLMEGIIVDITDKKQLEGQLQQSRRMEAVGRLAGGIAHDFNNLLTIIKGYTELALIRAKGMPELRSDIERIEDASERAAGLVRQLLAFSRRQVMQPKVLDLNGIVVGLDKLLRRLMDEDIEMVTVANDNGGRDQGRSGTDRASHHESGGECARCDAERRAADR